MRLTFQFVQLLLLLCLHSLPTLCAIGASAETESRLPDRSAKVAMSSSSINSRIVREVSQNQTQFSVEYTLLTANSPDCAEPSMVDNFPVRVQYRTVTLMEDDNGININRGSASQWTDLESPTLESGQFAFIMFGF